MIDPELRQVLETIGNGDFVVMDSDRPDEVLPGLSHAEKLGFVIGDDGGGYNVSITFRLTNKGRAAIGLPELAPSVWSHPFFTLVMVGLGAIVSTWAISLLWTALFPEAPAE